MIAGLPGAKVISFFERLAGISKGVSKAGAVCIAHPDTVPDRAGSTSAACANPRIARRASRKPAWARSALVVSALALASCGGGDEESADSQSPGGNGAPTIGGNAPPQVLVGNAFQFSPTASDPDGDTLTYSIENPPPWATFDTSTGRLSGTPEAADVGSYSNIRISVTDGTSTSSLAVFVINVVSTSSGVATLSWQAPTQKTDGTPVELAGYKIYYGTSSRNYTNSVTIDSPGIMTYVIEQLTPATWYFAVTAVDPQGIESDYSNEATKQIM